MVTLEPTHDLLRLRLGLPVPGQNQTRFRPHQELGWLQTQSPDQSSRNRPRNLEPSLTAVCLDKSSGGSGVRGSGGQRYHGGLKLQGDGPCSPVQVFLSAQVQNQALCGLAQPADVPPEDLPEEQTDASIRSWSQWVSSPSLTCLSPVPHLSLTCPTSVSLLSLSCPHPPVHRWRLKRRPFPSWTGAR